MRGIGPVLLVGVLAGCGSQPPPALHQADGERAILFTFFQTLPSGYRVESIFSIRPDGSGLDTVLSGGAIPLRGSAHPAGLLARLPAWSPDGSRVAFQGYWSSPDQEVRETRLGRVGRIAGSDIFMVNSDGTDIRRITNDPYQDSGPVFSPDGSQIAYTSTRDGNSDVFIVDTLGTEMRRITDSPSRECCPDWSPDGTRLLYVSDTEERPGLYVVDIDGATSTWLAAGSIGRWAPDGTRIAFHARTCAMLDPLARNDEERCKATGRYGVQGNVAAFLISPDGSNLKRVWPPDGEVARVSSPDGHLSGLGHRPLYPVWSPDGTRLAVHAPSPAFAKDPAWQDEIDRISDYYFRDTEDQLTPRDSAIWAERLLVRGIHILVIDTTGVKATDVTIHLEGAGHPAWSAGAGP